MSPLFRLTAAGYYKSRTSLITGDVTIGPDSSLWFNSIIRGDVAPITLGSRVNVQDNAVIHCDSGIPNLIADDVVIGHSAVVHGASIGPSTLIGMSATILGRSRIGAECLIAAGAVVPPGLQVPDRMVVMGVPGKIVRPIKPEELAYIRHLTSHYVDLAKKHVAGLILEQDPA